MNLILKQLSQNDETEFLVFFNSFLNEEKIPALIDIKSKTFSEYLEYLNTMKTDPPRLLVPITLLFLINEDTSEIIGSVSVRHFLSGQILNFHGQLSFSIKKEYRGQKLAEKMIKMAKDYMLSLDLKEILICCDNDNIPANKTIQNLNAKMENQLSTFKGDTEILINRYWLSLDEMWK